MVTIGFIVEGPSDKIFFESEQFRNYLKELTINFIPEVINANGNGNLLPKNINEFTESLIAKGATHIFIITDLDADKCVTLTKERIKPLAIHKCIVVKKDIEAWFLADSKTMSLFLIATPSFIKMFNCNEGSTFSIIFFATSTPAIMPSSFTNNLAFEMV